MPDSFDLLDQVVNAVDGAFEDDGPEAAVPDGFVPSGAVALILYRSVDGQTLLRYAPFGLDLYSTSGVLRACLVKVNDIVDSLDPEG